MANLVPKVNNTGSLGTSAKKWSNVHTTTLSVGAQASALSLNSQKITNLATPTASTDAATKAYVDDAVQGLSAKDSVRAATTANGTLSSAFANGQAIDGVTLATGDRILLKNQTAGAENGIYTVNASGAPTRAVDFDANAEVAKGAFIFVEEGTTNADAGFVLTTDGAITLGTTALAFTQFSGAGDITAGDALTKSGNTLSVAVDDSSIEISSDALRVKASGITSAMLAGSIANSKLNTISTANKVAISSLDLDGGTDIGADLVDADLVIVDDGAGGTNRKSALSRMKKYIFSAVSGDATASDAGALTIAANAVEGSMLNNNTISGQTEMTGDVADADELLISDNGTLKRADFSVVRDAVFADVSGDATIAAGGALTIGSGAIETAMVNDNVLTGQTAETSIADDDLVLIYDTSATALRKMTKANFVSGLSGGAAADDITTGDAAVTIATSAGNITLDAQGSDTDIIFKGTDGSSDTTFLTLDGSAAGTATFNSSIISGGAILPSAANSQALGSTTAEWSDLYLGDSSRIYFGNDQDVYLEHDPDDGLKLKVPNSSTYDPQFEILSDNASSWGPRLKFNHNSSSPAVNDTVGYILFNGNNAGGSEITYGQILSQIVDTSNSNGHVGKTIVTAYPSSGNRHGLVVEGVSTTKVKVNVTAHNGTDSGLHLDGTLVTSTAAELNLLDGGTSATSTTLVDADRVIVNDDGTMKQVALSDVKTYIGAGAADDLTTGDAAVTLATSAGNITIDAQGNDTDIIFKGTDNNSDITMLTLDGSEAGDATFNRNVTVTGDIILDDGGSIKEAGGTAAITIDASGEVTKIGQDTPSNGEFLQWDGSNSKVVWAAASGGSASAPGVTSASPSSAYTISTHAGIEEIYLLTPSTAITVNLPAAASAGAGYKYQIKNLSSNTITVDPNSSETIDGSATVDINTQYSSLTVVTDGSNWFII